MSEDLEIPQFKSSIPESLLENVSDKDRHILDAISIIQQQNAWQMEILKKTLVQATKTNGRVTKLESKEAINKSDIEEIKKELGENRDSLTDIKGIRALLSKRWFLLGAAMIAIFVLFFIYPYLLATTTYKDVIEVLKGLF